MTDKQFRFARTSQCYCLGQAPEMPVAKRTAPIREHLKQEVDPHKVIIHTFDINSVRSSSRNDEMSIQVLNRRGPKPFEEASTLFESIDERYKEGFVEVYAPVSWETRADRSKAVRCWTNRYGRDLAHANQVNNARRTVMDARTFVQLGLLALGGKVQGKTKLQKSMYFLGLMTGCLDDLGYRAHYYLGRTPRTLPRQWTGSGSSVRLTSHPRAWGRLIRLASKIPRYNYRLNSKGSSFAQSTAGRHQALWQKVQKAAELLSEAGDMDYASLSIAAKTYFLLDEKQGPASREELRR